MTAEENEAYIKFTFAEVIELRNALERKDNRVRSDFFHPTHVFLAVQGQRLMKGRALKKYETYGVLSRRLSSMPEVDRLSHIRQTYQEIIVVNSQVSRTGNRLYPHYFLPFNIRIATRTPNRNQRRSEGGVVRIWT